MEKIISNGSFLARKAKNGNDRLQMDRFAMSNILNMCRDLAKDLHQVGAMDDTSLRKIEEICVLKAEAFKAEIEAPGKFVPDIPRAARKSEDLLKDPKK